MFLEDPYALHQVLSNVTLSQLMADSHRIVDFAGCCCASTHSKDWRPPGPAVTSNTSAAVESVGNADTTNESTR